jgi:hypothetical protein
LRLPCDNPKKGTNNRTQNHFLPILLALLRTKVSDSVPNLVTTLPSLRVLLYPSI